MLRRRALAAIGLAALGLTGCGSDAGPGPRMVQDPPPPGPDEKSSDNMPTSKKNRAKFGKTISER